MAIPTTRADVVENIYQIIGRVQGADIEVTARIMGEETPLDSKMALAPYQEDWVLELGEKLFGFKLTLKELRVLRTIGKAVDLICERLGITDQA